MTTDNTPDVFDFVNMHKEDSDKLKESPIAALRNLTHRFGVIHETQINLLKNMPVIVIAEADSATVEIALKDKTINYIVKCAHKVEDMTRLKNQTFFLTECVKTILGDAWVCGVKCFVKKKVVYEYEQ